MDIVFNDIDIKKIVKEHLIAKGYDVESIELSLTNDPVQNYMPSMIHMDLSNLKIALLCTLKDDESLKNG